MNQEKPVKISGLVILVKSEDVTWNNQRYRTQLKIETLQSKQRYLCLLDFFLPVEKNEYFEAFGTRVSDKYIIISPRPQPYVMISTCRRDIENCFVRALRGKRVGIFKAAQIYDHFEKLIKADSSYDPSMSTTSLSSKVSGLITHLAELYHDQADARSLDYFSAHLNLEQSQHLINWWYRNRELRRLYLLGLYNKEINACRLPASKIYERCKTNPLTLSGIPIKKALNISQSLGVEISPQMFDCGQVIRAIRKSMDCGGHVGMSLKRMEKLQPKLVQLLPELKKNYQVICDFYTLYLEQAYEAESYLVDFIVKQIKERDRISDDDPFHDTVNQSNKEEKDQELTDPPPVRLAITSTSDLELTEDQRRAVQGALDHPISIITGPPGTGKTSVIRQIVHNLELRDQRYWITSFTGKAVSRIKEVLGRESSNSSCISTIHRLIGTVKKMNMDKTSETAVLFNHLIIDEFSMVDTELLYDLLYSIRGITYSLTLVGDKDQLSPIGWGQAFTSMIKSQRIPIYFLEKCHRVYDVQGETDGITLNARLILKAQRGSPLLLEETANFRLIEGDSMRVQDIVQEFFQQSIKREDFLICCPYNRYLQELNDYCQEVYNLGQKSHQDQMGNIWRVEDKILQRRNDYEANVFNGQVGYIVDVNHRGVQVKFDENQLVTYPFRKEENPRKNSSMGNYSTGRFSSSYVVEQNEDPMAPVKERTINDISLGYAGSVHSWQGSEANYVIFYVPIRGDSNRFINQTLIYTAITRAKRACFVISEDLDGFAACCKQPPPFRLDNLAKRLNDRLPEHPTNIIYRRQQAEIGLVDEILDDFDDDFDWEDHF